MPKGVRKSTGKAKPGPLAKSPLSVVQNAASEDDATSTLNGQGQTLLTITHVANGVGKTSTKAAGKKARLSQVSNASSQKEPMDSEMADAITPTHGHAQSVEVAPAMQVPLQVVPLPPDFYEHTESIDLGMYLDSNPPTMYRLPDEILYSTSFLVATIQPNQSLQMKSIAAQDDPIAQFREELFNIGNCLAVTEESKKAIHRPSFYSTLGDYQFATPKDRDLAIKYGFTDEKDMFDWLNRLLGSGQYLDEQKFSTPWHDIEMRFIPRHRNSNEEDVSKMYGGAKPKPKVRVGDDGDDSGKGKGKRRSMAAVRYPTPPDGDEPELPYTINLDHLINAVVRHPLLFPAYPVPAEFIVRNSPHQLTDNSLLYVLSHGRMENENLSDRMRELGMFVAANVITHRKKKALKLLPNGDRTYEQRKKQFDLYKRSIERAQSQKDADESVPPPGNNKGFWSTVLDA